jgi:hypothetical protein
METQEKNTEMKVIVFGNRTPVRTNSDNIKLVHDSNQNFGHDRIYLIHSKNHGKYILYTSYNSGCSYGSHPPKTTKTSLGTFDTKEELILFLKKGNLSEEGDFQTAGEILEEIGGVEIF